MESTTPFLARECFLLSSDRLYRVYSSGAELAFVKVAGQGGVGRAVAVQFGLIGALVNAWLEKKAKAKFSEKIAALDG